MVSLRKQPSFFAPGLGEMPLRSGVKKDSYFRSLTGGMHPNNHLHVVFKRKHVSLLLIVF